MPLEPLVKQNEARPDKDGRRHTPPQEIRRHNIVLLHRQIEEPRHDRQNKGSPYLYIGQGLKVLRKERPAMALSPYLLVRKGAIPDGACIEIPSARLTGIGGHSRVKGVDGEARGDIR